MDIMMIGNDIIEKALAAVNENANQDTVMALIHALQDRLVADGHLLLPVDHPDPDNTDTFRLRTVLAENGDEYIACFTSVEELHKGEPTAVISQFIDVFLEAVIDHSSVKGIVINPFGHSFHLSKGAIQIVLEAKQPSEDDYIRRNYLLEKAIHFATSKHAGQLRKGTTIPYIVHPLEVMNILRTMGADTNLLIAGLLHDTVEDTDTTVDEIIALFGTDVGCLVSGHSEDKSKTWKQRKAHAIRHLADANVRFKMLVMADKVSNLRSIFADYKALGDDLWARFNAPKEQQAWYYSGIQDALWDMQNYEETKDVYWEMVGLYKDVFVKYYHVSHSPGEEALVQVSAHGKIYRLVKGSPAWKPKKAFDPSERDCSEISRTDAEAMEDMWNKSFWACVDRDLSDNTYSLVCSRDRSVDITIQNGKLSLDGNDYGSACESINGKDEYEYHISLDEDSAKRLMTQLRMDHGITLSTRDLFLKVFGTQMPSSKLMNYCKKKEIYYRFFSF